ncbi:Sec-independent protein translocase subunit TatA [Streptomyces syringium]|uniref:Sec-independent protein translocase subunit TatA n=1 Tax=Streptomyces syringium TaxID=76729 RepID=UPI0034520A93
MLRNALEPWHILVVVLAVVVLFGSKKLPDTARALGKSMRILKSEARAMRSDGADTAGTDASGEPATAPGSPADSRR